MFSAFNEVLKVRNLYYKLKGLNRLFLSGEALSSQLVKEFNEKREDHILPELINLYGPTEATVDVSYFNCPGSKVNKVFIGRPIDNTKLFVVSKRNKLQPVGIPGELIITGVNLARGYLNDNNLTNKKFFDLRVSGGKRMRAYHSGDIVKLPPEGELEYIGRMDNQVKIRGFRVEPGEIESKILEHPSVSNCAVITRNNLETNSLIAYVCLKSNEKVGEASLKNFLSKKLPEYTIPSKFLFLTKLPLTISGKLDRNKLPPPDQIQLKNNFEVPSNNFEKRLLSIWKYLLKTEKIDVNDNFFDIGGNSLLAIIMTSKVAEEFDIVINAMAIFEFSSIKKLSEFISSGIKESFFPENDKIDEKTRHKKNLRRMIKDD
ncbi:MAG: non-ribosomal peptide synthetase, partial [Bacteroidales bacterium]